MRPDEHKKKKNAVYKKKHGIAGKGSFGGDETEEKGQGSISKKGGGRVKKQADKIDKAKVKGKPEVTKLQQHDGHSHSHESGDSESSSSGEECDPRKQGKGQVKKAFKRREIASNWQKYELEPELEDAARGEDFQKLLNSAGSALSHFRLKDELDWQEDTLPPPGTGNGDQDDQSQLLSINPTQLAQSLSCLPLHTVLGIQPDVFTADQLLEDKKTAEERRQFFLTNTGDKLSLSSLSVSDCGTRALDMTSDLSSEKTSTVTSKSTIINSNLLSSTPNNSPAPVLSPDKSSFLKDTKKPSKNIQKSIHLQSENSRTEDTETLKKEPVQGEVSATVESVEDDLDFLLSLDSPQSAERGHQTANVRDTGDALRASEAIAEPTHDAGKGSKAKVVPESEDLEDWLDSVLDS